MPWRQPGGQRRAGEGGDREPDPSVGREADDLVERRGRVRDVDRPRERVERRLNVDGQSRAGERGLRVGGGERDRRAGRHRAGLPRHGRPAVVGDDRAGRALHRGGGTDDRRRHRRGGHDRRSSAPWPTGEPPLPVAVTTTDSVVPMSSGVSVYEDAVAAAIGTQAAPVASQRRHWYANELGEPVHEPANVVSVWPAWARPDTAGATIAAGLARAPSFRPGRPPAWAATRRPPFRSATSP